MSKKNYLRLFAIGVGIVLMCLFFCSCTPQVKLPNSLATKSGEEKEWIITLNQREVDVVEKFEKHVKTYNKIYFALNSSEITEANKKLIKKHAIYINAHKIASVEIAGHADERGTEEYNQQLGQSRADAVCAELQLNGIKLDKLKCVSYGKTKPAVVGNNEQAYSKNRRVVFVYSK